MMKATIIVASLALLLAGCPTQNDTRAAVPSHTVDVDAQQTGAEMDQARERVDYEQRMERREARSQQGPAR